MYVPHRGSIRVAGLVRRILREDVKIREQRKVMDFFRKKASDLLDSVSVIQPEDTEEISVSDVLSGKVSARIRVGGAFGSVEKVNLQIVEYETESFRACERAEESEAIRDDCLHKLISLVGKNAANRILKEERRRV